MAGVIAAKDQITGIAPNVEILSALAFAPPKKGESASGTTYAIIKSMDWAYRSGARVFNLSFAGPKDKLLIKALDALADHDAIMIGAAGNAGPGKPPAYPAAHDGVIAVTATDQNDALYTMANRGTYVAVAAPGVDIITTTPGGGYEFVSGTSIATAHVTGVVALVLERHPDLKAGHVAQLLANASIDLGAKGVDSEFGAGLVDAVAALKSSDELADAATLGLTAGQ
jgi:subtilisin family serine protease